MGEEGFFGAGEALLYGESIVIGHNLCSNRLRNDSFVTNSKS